MKIKGRFLTTGIGSLPYLDPLKSSEKICKDFSIPFWPQLPKRDFNENMYSQFSQGLPGAIIDRRNKRLYVQGSKDLSEGLAKIYEATISGEHTSFGITKEFAEGLYAFIEVAKKYKPQYVKGHVTGPVSLGLGIADENGKAIIYNSELKEALVRLLAIKAVWQINQLKALSSEIIIFIDEPYLTSFGSSFVNIQRQDIVSMLNVIIQEIHSKGSIAGVHCCGNTDWSIFTDTDIDIINFDAYAYLDSVLLYYKEINKFLQRGGCLAWGIVPTSEAVLKETSQTLFEQLSKGIEELEKKSIPRNLMIANSILTPSCGMGTLSEALTEDIITKLNRVSKLAKGLT
jgi:methionine synthase II (cobalamin-independent)